MILFLIIYEDGKSTSTFCFLLYFVSPMPCSFSPHGFPNFLICIIIAAFSIRVSPQHPDPTVSFHDFEILVFLLLSAQDHPTSQKQREIPIVNDRVSGTESERAIERRVITENDRVRFTSNETESERNCEILT